jgi:WD40 repeat protein
MTFIIGKRLPFVTLALLSLALPPVAAADEPGGLMPPRVKPASERTVGILPWDPESTAPWGGWSRSGGSDRRTFCFSPDGKLIATEDSGGWQVELWDVATGKSLSRFGRFHNSVALAFSADGKTVATTGRNHHDLCAVDLWDVTTRKRLRSLDEGVNVIPFTAAAFSPDGKTLALGAGWSRRRPEKFGIHLWDVTSGDEVRRFEGPEPSGDINQSSWRSDLFDAICFAPDGRSLVLVGDNRVWLWELAGGKERCLLGLLPSAYPPKNRSEEAPPCAAISPDGRTVALGCPDGVIRLFDVARGQPLQPLVGHRGWVRAVAFAPEGKSLLSLGVDNKVLTWPLGQALQPWQPKHDRLSADALEALWKELLDEDVVTGYAAMRNLAARPGQALALLREQIKPVLASDSQQVGDLVATLAGNDFNACKRAAIELRKRADLALPALRKTIGRGDDEIQRRLLERLEAEYPTREQLRALRALEVLELMGTPEATKLLGDLATGAQESMLASRAKAIKDRLERTDRTAGSALTDDLWTALAHEDGRRGFAGMRALWAAPDKAVPFLRERLRGVATLEWFDDDPQRMDRLVADLDSDDFATRDRATKALATLGKRAEPALRKALASQTSAEAVRRIKELLEGRARGEMAPERLRVLRALEVLEVIGDDVARQTLEALGKDAKSRWLKDAAAEALGRLKR